ncbi:MAG: hypothetical protein K8L99_00240 [Anaerolineae bacterium]|nr:hypothetical protein [Anaerolineae bacterium]
MTALRRIFLLAVTLLVSACARQNEVELSLVSTNVVLRTEIAQIQDTATVAADRLQITVEYAATLVAQSQAQNGELRATLVSGGSDPNALDDINAQVVTPLPTTDTIPNIGVTPFPTPPTGGSDPETDPGAGAATAEVTEETSAPTLTNIVMARSVGSDDCAQDVTSSFTTSDDEIYVVATALNITPGTTISAQYNIGSETIQHNFTPDFAINQNCIWFFTDQTDVAFTTGTWNVTLSINGTPVSQPVQFTISE